VAQATYGVTKAGLEPPRSADERAPSGAPCQARALVDAGAATVMNAGRPGFSIGLLVRSRGYAPSRRGAMHPVVDDQGQSFARPMIWPVEPPEHDFTALLAKVRVKDPSIVIDVDHVVAGWFWVVVCHLSVLHLVG
jgi:hypothetical protein